MEGVNDSDGIVKIVRGEIDVGVIHVADDDLHLSALFNRAVLEVSSVGVLQTIGEDIAVLS